MTKLRLILCFILFAPLCISAQKSIRIWDGTDMTRKQKWSKLTVFLPETPDTSGISVVICPGGSYYWMDRDNEGYSVAKYLNQHCIAAFVLQYRTARKGNHHPAMIEDLERAMYLVKQNAGKYKINPEKLGVMGFSAGGHLVGTQAIYSDTRFLDARHKTDVSLKPYFAAMIYPVVTMTNEEIVHKKSRENLLGKQYSPEMAEKMSLEKNVVTNMPPFFLLHCKNDQTVDYHNSVVFSTILTEKDNPHKFLLFDECGEKGHGFGIQPIGEAAGWIDVFISWVLSIE